MEKQCPQRQKAGGAAPSSEPLAQSGNRLGEAIQPSAATTYGGVEGHRLLLYGIGTRILGGLEDALAAHRIGHRNRTAINNNVGITTAVHNTGMIRTSIRVRIQVVVVYGGCIMGR